MRWIPKQLGYLMLAASSVAAGNCPDTMRSNLSSPCIKDQVFNPTRYGSLTWLRHSDLWQLDAGSVHPPVRLHQLKIERLVMESLWGLRPGESMIGDPRWGAGKLQPDLDAIASLRAREKAMTSRRVGN